MLIFAGREEGIEEYSKVRTRCDQIFVSVVHNYLLLDCRSARGQRSLDRLVPHEASQRTDLSFVGWF